MTNLGSFPIDISEPNSVTTSPQISPGLRRGSIRFVSNPGAPHQCTPHGPGKSARPSHGTFTFSGFPVLQSLSTPAYPLLWAFSSSPMSAMVLLAFPSPGMDHHYFQASWNPHSSEFTLYSEVLARVLNLITWKTALKSINSPLSKLMFWLVCSKPQNPVLRVPFRLPHLQCWSFFFGVIPFLPLQNPCTPVSEPCNWNLLQTWC